MKLSSSTLLVRADASPAIGCGHVMRCLALAKVWQHSIGDVCFLIAESIPSIEDRLIREGIGLRRIEVSPGTAVDAERTFEQAKDEGAAWVVVDGYRFGPDYVRRIKDAGSKVLFLDDDGRFNSYVADVVLNQNISANDSMYEHREPHTRFLMGSRYVLLRPEFRSELRRREHPAVGRNILVTMGGSDAENVTRVVLAALEGVMMRIDVRVIIGSGYLQCDELQDFIRQLPVRIRIVDNPENMAPLMRWADIAVSGAGGTCWELAYMGVPSITLALSRDQQSIAQGLAKNDIVENLGWHADASKEKIARAIDSLLNDPERRTAMAERAQNLVDGCGASRVVSFLQNCL